MNYGTISADIIAFTALPETERRKLETAVNGLLSDLSKTYQSSGFFGRLVQGDYIECAFKNPEYLLRILLLIKTLVKSIHLDISKNRKNQRLKHFREHGVRIAGAIAPLEKLDSQKGIIDGEAIYLSGRAIKKQSSSDKQKVVIKNSLFFFCNDEDLQQEMDTLFSLIDVVLSRNSAKQSEVIFYKLCNFTENEISVKLNKSQSTISQHSTASGWNSIEKAILYFENKIQQWNLLR